MSTPRAIGTSGTTQEKRDRLHAYVRDNLFGTKPVSAAVLARLVNDAPAMLTLDAIEWWNVAVFLAATHGAAGVSTGKDECETGLGGESEIRRSGGKA